MSLEVSIRHLQAGVFGVLHLLSLDNRMGALLGVFLSVFNFLQMLSFPFGSSGTLPWENDTVMRPAGLVTEYVSLSGPGEFSHKSLHLSLFLVAICWVLLFLSVLTAAGSQQQQGKATNAALNRTMRIMARVSMNLIFIPVVSSLFRIMRCSGDSWLEVASIPCWSAAHVSLLVITLLMLTAFVVVMLAIALSMFDRNPTEPGWNSQLHGRVDACMLCVKVALAFVYNVIIEDASLVLISLLVLGSGLTWLSLQYKWQPFIRMQANCLEMMFAGVYCLAAVCLLIAQLAPSDRVGYMFTLAAAPAAVASWTSVSVRFRALVLYATEAEVLPLSEFVLDAWVSPCTCSAVQRMRDRSICLCRVVCARTGAGAHQTHRSTRGHSAEGQRSLTAKRTPLSS